MTKERTLSIIKPDAVERSIIGKICDKFEVNGLHIIACKMLRMKKRHAEKFYAVHKKRPFFNELVEFISSGPIVVQILEGDHAIAKNRELMGNTDPKKAHKGTIRRAFAESIGRNVVHGSDSPETAQKEINFFFSEEEIFSS